MIARIAARIGPLDIEEKTPNAIRLSATVYNHLFFRIECHKPAHTDPNIAKYKPNIIETENVNEARYKPSLIGISSKERCPGMKPRGLRPVKH